MSLRVQCEGMTREFGTPVVRFGRGLDNDIVLCELIVSEHHAEAHCRVDGWGREQWDVVDLKSTNGTYLRGTRVYRHSLQNGDLLTFGDRGPTVTVELGARAPMATSERVLLSYEWIEAIVDATTSSELVNARDVLLANIDKHLVGMLPTDVRPRAQILSDLNELNLSSLHAGRPLPLVTWLKNAISLAGPRVEAEVFVKACEEILRVTGRR